MKEKAREKQPQVPLMGIIDKGKEKRSFVKSLSHSSVLRVFPVIDDHLHVLDRVQEHGR